MRIISQDGFYDIPYEHIIIECTGEVIFARDIKSNNYSVELARYSTHEKAKKAMEQLHNVYENYMAEATPDGNGFCFIPPKVFQFPTEEELDIVGVDETGC